jgi:hypothetical protein
MMFMDIWMMMMMAAYGDGNRTDQLTLAPFWLIGFIIFVAKLGL